MKTTLPPKASELPTPNWIAAAIQTFSPRNRQAAMAVVRATNSGSGEMISEQAMECAFRTIYGRPSTAEERESGLWEMLCEAAY